MGKAIVSLLLFVSTLSGQTYAPWDRLDTVTSGEFEDSNPVLDRGGTAWYDSHPPVHWLIFERRSGTSSAVVAKRFYHESTQWDTASFVISTKPAVMELSHPTICTNSTGYSNAESSWTTYEVLSAWEVTSDCGREIWCSRFDTKRDAWNPATAITSDSVDDSSPRIFPWNDSTFAIIWKRGRALVYSLITPSHSTPIDTILTSNLDDFEFDLISLRRRYTTPGEPVVWTVLGKNGRRTLAATSLQIDSTIRAGDVDTLQWDRDVYSPAIFDNLG